MKKFLVALSALLVLAAAALFLGWAQMGVPPDSVGVLRSRSHGTDPRLVVPGDFMWVWYRLIPTNASTAVFRLEPVRRDFRTSGMLPSAHIYSAFLGIHFGAAEDFSWEIAGTVSFRPRPEALIALTERLNLLSQDDLDRHLAEVADAIGNMAAGWFAAAPDAVRHADPLMGTGGLDGIARTAEARFPEIADVSLTVRTARLPDFAVYEQARYLHAEFVRLRMEHVTERLPEIAGDRLSTFTRIEELEMHGELLTRFPILLEYLRIEGEPLRGSGTGDW